MYVMVSKTESEGGDVPEAVKPVWDEFRGVFPDELSNGLPPLRDSSIRSIWFLAQPCHTDRTTALAQRSTKNCDVK